MLKVNKLFGQSMTVIFSKRKIYLLTFAIALFAILYLMGYYRHIAIFAMLYGLFLFMNKNIISALTWAFFVWILYYIAICQGNWDCSLFERFENDDKEKEDEDGDGKEDLRDKLEILIKELESKHGAKDGVQDTFDNLNKYVEKMKGGIELREDDVENTGPVGIDVTRMSFDDEKPNPLKRAQIETYELIDTIGTLKETHHSISPILSEGKRVMDMFKGLNMT